MISAVNPEQAKSDLRDAFKIERLCHDASDRSVEWLRYEDAIAMVDTALDLSKISLSQGNTRESELWLKEAMNVIDNKEDLYDMVPSREIAAEYKKLLKVNGHDQECKTIDAQLSMWQANLDQKYGDSLRTLPELPDLELRRNCALNFRADYLAKVADAVALTGGLSEGQAAQRDWLHYRKESLDCERSMTNFGDERIELIQLAQIYSDEAEIDEDEGHSDQSSAKYEQALLASKKSVECIEKHLPSDPALLVPALITQSAVLKKLKRNEEAANVEGRLDQLVHALSVVKASS